MAYAFTVAILKGTYDLTVYPPGIIFVHSSVWLRFQEPMSGSPGNVLHDQDNLILSLDGFIKFGDMRMVKSFHELDLSSDRLFPLDFLHFLL